MTTSPIVTLAAAFVSELRATLTPHQWRKMRAANKAEGNPAVCHSHDYCDANMVMAAAFEKVVGREPDVDDHNDTALWNAAWSAAMPALGRED